jgi:hypothetical protein
MTARFLSIAMELFNYRDRRLSRYIPDSHARQDCHANLPLPTTTYLRQVYLDTDVFSYHPAGLLARPFGAGPYSDGHGLPF